MKSHIIGFLLVTLAQIPMPIKIGTTFQNKLLPNGKSMLEYLCAAAAANKRRHHLSIANIQSQPATHPPSDYKTDSNGKN